MQYDAVDECKFCVRTFWRPWLQELLDIEGAAKQEETAATLDARDATSKSERNFALRRREVAAEAILSIRVAKNAVMNALEAIDAEKAKRYALDKEKYGIAIKKTVTDTKYKEHMAKAIKAKKIQELKFEIMNEWSNKWATLKETIADAEAEEDKHSAAKKERVLKPKSDFKDESDETEQDNISKESDTNLKRTPSRQKGGLAKKTITSQSKEKLGQPGKDSSSGKDSPRSIKEKKESRPSKEKLGTTTDKEKQATEKKEKGTKDKLTAEMKVTDTPPGKDSPTRSQSKDKLNIEKKEQAAKPGDEKVTVEKKKESPTTQQKLEVEKKELVATPPSNAKSTPEKKDTPSPPSPDKKTPENDKK